MDWFKRYVFPVAAFVFGCITATAAIYGIFYPNPGAVESFVQDFEAGLNGLDDPEVLEDPNAQLRIISRLEEKLQVNPATNYAEILKKRRGFAEETIRKRNELADKAEADRVAKQQHAEKLERVRLKKEQQRLEAKREKELARINSRIAEERICRDSACTSWIIP